MPRPARFHQVWAQQGKTPLFIWELVPPHENFVALGMVCSTDGAEPWDSEVRCVPKTWINQTEAGFLWSDAGTGGAPAVFWIDKSLRHMGVTSSNDAAARTAPKGMGIA